MSNNYRYIEKRNDKNELIDFCKVKSTTSLEKITNLQEEFSKNKIVEEKRKADEQSAFLIQEEKRKFLETYSYTNFVVVALPLLLSGKFTDLSFIIELGKIADKEVLANQIKSKLELPNYALIKEIFSRQFLK